MIAMDGYIIDFVSNNWLTMSVALGILKVAAKLYPGSKDDEIVQMIADIFKLFRPGAK